MDCWCVLQCKDKPTVIGHMFDDLALQPDVSYN